MIRDLLLTAKAARSARRGLRSRLPVAVLNCAVGRPRPDRDVLWLICTPHHLGAEPEQNILRRAARTRPRCYARGGTRVPAVGARADPETPPTPASAWRWPRATRDDERRRLAHTSERDALLTYDEHFRDFPVPPSQGQHGMIPSTSPG
jgi:hypothetical protein